MHGLNSLLAVCCCPGFEWRFGIHREEFIGLHAVVGKFREEISQPVPREPSFAFRVREAFLLIGYRSWWCGGGLYAGGSKS